MRLRQEDMQSGKLWAGGVGGLVDKKWRWNDMANVWLEKQRK